MTDLIYACDLQPRQIRIAPEALAKLSEHRQTRLWQTEAGGQLFGVFDSDRITVKKITGPNRRDLRSRFSFVPDRTTEQKDIDAMFASGLHYIGDWHTHAEDRPSPSAQDIGSINRCFRESRHELQYFLLVIVGRLPFPDGLCVCRANGSAWATLSTVHP